MRRASFGTCCHEGTSPPTVLISLRACDSDLLGSSPDTTAVMLRASPLPAPASQDPRQRVPAVSRLTRRPIRRPGSLQHNSELCPQNRCLVTRLARGPALRMSAWLPSRAPSHRRILHASGPATARLDLSRGVDVESQDGEVSPSCSIKPPPLAVTSWRWTVAVFRSIFCAAVPSLALTSPLSTRASYTWCPLKITPTRRLVARAFKVKGDRPDRTAEHKKKTMKTNRKIKNQSGLQSRPEQQQSTATAAQPPAALSPEAPAQSPIIRVDFAKRQENRQLPTERVIELLKSALPIAYERAEVVGQWVWVSFTDKQPQSITAALSQLGFHWNNRRQVWQHPCGVFKGEPVDPRSKYQTVSAQEVAA